MIQQVKFSRINTDVDDHEINTNNGEYRMMTNLVPAKTGIGRGNIRESLKGTEEIPITDSEYPFGSKVIGTFEDKPTGKIYTFVWTGDFNRIMVYDSKSKVFSRIIQSTKFDWSEDTKIVGIGVLDGVIYWSDPKLNYYIINDQNQVSEIDYNVLGIISSSVQTYRFIADFQTGESTNFQFNITGPISDTDAANALVTAMNNASGFNAYFIATLTVGSTVIKIKSKTIPGSVKLTGTPGEYYNYYQTNFDRQPDSSDDFLLYPPPPVHKPEIVPLNDGNIVVNKILNKNWQFAHRLIFLNNQISDFGAYSDIYPATKYPEEITDTSIPNTLWLLLAVENPEKVKTVEIAARTSETGEWFIIKALDRSEFFTLIATDNVLSYLFNGTEQQIPVSTADAIKQQSGIPRESIDMQILKNKIFAIDNLTGFDYEDNDMSMTINIVEEAWTEGGRWFKEGGLYNVAVRFFNDLMETDGTVHNVTQINIPENPSTSWDTNPTGSGKSTSRKQFLSVEVAGKPPTWARYWKFVRSDELRYGSTTQFHSWIHYYVRPQVDTDDPDSGVLHYYMNGNQYTDPDEISLLSQYRYLHLQLPTNISIVPERGMIVHVLAGNNTGGPEQFTVLDVQGNMLVLEQPINLVNGFYPVKTLFIELYAPKNVAETNNFYEVGETYDVINPGLDTRSFAPGPYRVDGDIFTVSNEDEKLNWKYDWDDYTKFESTEAEKGLRKDKYTWGYNESYSQSYSATQAQDVQISQVVLSPEFGFDFGYIPDPTLASRNFGRPAPLLQNVRQENRDSTVKWSNDYIEDASINGLHTFEPLNEYALPLERGPVIKLQSAGEDVLLAIHSSGVTSMYIGKGIIRSANLNPTLVTTEGVIGTDNALKHSFGTTHPSSVTEVDGNVYFWDGNRNEPVRYAQNGLTAMATTFMTRVLFKETIPSMFGTPDTYDCISGFDRLLNMIFFTFIKGSTKFTIGFHEGDKAWIASYGFTPEYYGAIGEEFVGFDNGIPWLHNQDSINANTFYGIRYPSTIKLIGNSIPALEMAWDSMVVDSNLKWDVPFIYNEEGQSTNLIADDFIKRDNIFYADLLRDVNTDPALLKPGKIALRNGKLMSSQTMTFELSLDTANHHYIRSIGIATTPKDGHYVQSRK